MFFVFFLDVFAHKLVGLRVSKNMHTDLVIDALDQAIWARERPKGETYLINRGS